MAGIKSQALPKNLSTMSRSKQSPAAAVDPLAATLYKKNSLLGSGILGLDISERTSA